MPPAVVQIDVTGGAVLVGGAKSVAEIDLESGTRRWHLLQDEARNFFGAGNFVRFLDGDLALVGARGGLVLLDRAAPGEPSVVWSREDAPAGVAVSDDEDLLVMTTGDDDLVALDMATGDKIWRVESDGARGESAIAPPRIIRDEVIVVPRSGGPDGCDRQTGELAWHNDDREAFFDWSALLMAI